MTLEEYFKAEAARGVSDHVLRATVQEDGRVGFYIHPANTDGLTRDFITFGESVVPDPNITYQDGFSQ